MPIQDCATTLHQRLNIQQHEAVHLGKGNFVFAATAGAGKTSVVVLRIAQLIKDGVDPTRIGAFTFTKDAANEMLTRGQQLGFPKELRISTLHSLCYEILREDGDFWGGKFKVDDNRLIYYELKNIISREYRDRGMDPRVATTLFGLAKANCLSYHPEVAGQYELEVLQLFEKILDRKWMAPAYSDLFRKLEIARNNRGLIDFDDMLILGWLTLVSDDEARSRWASKFDYILVDEAQDSSRVQNAVSVMLSEICSNLTLCGDVQQSIYKFRGAQPDEFVDFSNKFLLCRLPINYRSTKQICAAATALTKDKIWNVTGETIPCDEATDDVASIVAVEFNNQEDEANAIALDIAEQIAHGAQPKDFSILYRVTALLADVENAMIKHNIPYIVKSDGTFYSRKEVKDVLSYVKVAAVKDPTEENVKRAINAPFRYLGKIYTQAVEDVAVANGVSFLDAMTQYKAPKEGQNTTAAKFYKLLRQMNEMYSKGAPPASMISFMLDQTRYIQSITREEGEDTADPDSGKAAHVFQLLRLASPFKTADEFLKYVEDMERVLAQNRKKKDLNAVVLSTIHSAKGLEWNTVFGVGWNEGILPHAKNPDQDEELRLAYVAITRARNKFQCSFNRNQVTPGGVVNGVPSRFIKLAQMPVRKLFG